MDIEDALLEDYFMFPWEAASNLEQLRNHWNDLRNQVIGRGIAPRKDVPKDLQGRVSRDYSSFKRWDEEISFGDRFLGTFQDELTHYSTILNEDWKLFNNWVAKENKRKGYKAEIPPTKPPNITKDEIPYGKVAVSLGSVATIAGLGFLALWLWKRN